MGIYKDKQTKEWVYKFEFQTKAYGARGFATRREAEAARVKRREEITEQSVAANKMEKAATDFKTVAYDYLDFAKRKYVRDVYLRKANVCKRFFASIARSDISIEQITSEHIHAYLKGLVSNSLYNEHRHELSALFNWVKKIYSARFPFLINPCIGIESMTYVPAEKTIPTEEEILRMIVAATPGDERDILLVCLQSLGRIDEVLRLRWMEDVNFDKRYITLWTRKRKNGVYEPDVLPMNDDLYDVLWARWNDRKQDQWVFWNKIANEGKGDRYKHRPRMMDSICKRAGLTPLGTRTLLMEPRHIRAFEKKYGRKIKESEMVKVVPRYYGFHALRHFMASYLMDTEKISLKTVSGLLRHKNVRTTEIYLHSVDSSQISASTQIKGKFTLKIAKPPQDAATKEEGVAK